jgi:protein involved in polysaccharide export with SLBB domain
MTRIPLHYVPLAIAFALAGGARAGAAQQPDDASVIERPMATREALEGALSRLESAHGDPMLIGRARARLTEGDFRSGDRIIISVQGDTALSDTFAVWQDQALHLPSPAVGTLPLTGVLRSEIQPKVTAFVARFVRNPMVRARPLIRLSFQGDFAHAGFYAVPADAPLADAFMAAGGTAATANMSKIKAERSGHQFMNARDIQSAISSNSTVDDLGLKDGDQFSMPRQNPGGMGTALRTAAIIVSLSVGVLTLTRHH